MRSRYTSRSASVSKTYLAGVAPLRDVKWNIGGEDAGKAGHEQNSQTRGEEISGKRPAAFGPLADHTKFCIL